jgi:tetratricopeptide (TPR) repeat protein
VNARVVAHARVLLLVLALLTVCTRVTALAAGSDPKPALKNTAETLYNEGIVLAEEGRHAAALQKFRAAQELKADDPDILNMIAHSLRKTGELEEAFATYEKALQLRDRFPQAREYLGEAHLQAALIQVQILRSYGTEGEEELATLLEALKRAANEAAGTDFEVAPAKW